MAKDREALQGQEATVPMMSADAIMHGALRVVSDAFRYINPYAQDKSPPNPEPTLLARRACGAAGATIAIGLLSLLALPKLEEARFNEWQILVYMLIAVCMILVGTSMGAGLEGRRLYKSVLGPLYGCLAAILVVAILLTAIVSWNPLAG